MTIRIDTPMGGELPHLRLLQLVSPALPIGAYAYSQGLESAVQAGWVGDEASLADWIGTLLDTAIARVDVPLLARLHAAWRRGDIDTVRRWSARLIAQRETAELRTDERDRGQALARLLRDLGVPEASPWAADADATLATLFSLASVRWGVGAPETARGYVWAWAENAVIAGVKLVPLGQVAGQRLLLHLADRIPAIVAQGLVLEDGDIGATLPGLAMLSCHHETQYSRLYRS